MFLSQREWLQAQLVFSPDGDGGGGEGESSPERSFQRALEKRNQDGVLFARELYGDNYELRRKNATLTAENAELKTKVPSDGSVVLTAEQAQQWSAYQAMGKPDEVKAIIEERGQLQGKLSTLERESTLRDVATHSGFHFSALQKADKLAELDGSKLTYEVREVERDGTKVKIAYVKDGSEEKPLVEYASEKWADLLPSLRVAQQESAPATNGRAQGVYYPPQHQGTQGNQPQTARTTAEATLSRQYAARKES